MSISLRRGARLAAIALPVSALLVLALTSCTSNNTTPSLADSSPSPQSEPSSAAATPTGNTAIVLELDGRDIQGHLDDSATSRSLLAQLPLTLKFRDHAGQEKIAPLPAALDLTGAPRSSAAPALTIGYYSPDQALVLYYANVGSFPGIVPIGTYENAVATRNQPDDFTLTIRAAH